MKTTKAIRFSEAELKEIDHFLKQNPFLDFSTMVRVAVREFLGSPSITFQNTGTNKNSKNLKHEVFANNQG